MQGRFVKRLGCGLAALLFVVTPAIAEDIQPYLTADPGYSNQGAPSHLVSNNTLAMNFEARIAALEAALAEKDKKECEWTDVSDQKWSGKVGGRIMGDFVMFANQDAQNLAAIGDQDNYFEFRRLRIFLSGKGYGVYDYKFQLDFEPEGIYSIPTVPDPTVLNSGGVGMKDMYVGIHEVPLLGYVRMGHFKGPSSLEELTSSKYITFMERSLPNAFAMGRNVGIAAFNNTHDNVFHINYGVFLNAVPELTKQHANDAQGIEVGIRGVWTPVYTANGRGVVHLGGSWRYVDDFDDLRIFASRPETHEEGVFINTPIMDARDYHVAGLEFAGVYGPFSLQSELFYTNLNTITGPNVDLYGAYAYASWFLTGESRNYENDAKVFGRVKPHTNFWVVNTGEGCCAGWGAWELAARWSYLDFTAPAYDVVNSVLVLSSGTLNTSTIGINWYWNPYARMMFDWIHAYGSDDARGAGNADILAMRWQVDF